MCECSAPGRLIPLLLNSSNYTQLKKNRILYHQYKVKYPDNYLCNKPYNIVNKKIQYKSYNMKQTLERGCWYDEYYCNCNCPNLTCKDNTVTNNCGNCDVIFNIPVIIP